MTTLGLPLLLPSASGGPWARVTKFDPIACAMADRHYSRQTPGSGQFMPPGQTLVLLTRCRRGLWGWYRPHPDSGVRRLDGLDGWFCSIFRNEGAGRSSDLILAAERVLLATHPDDCGPDGLLTYVAPERIKGSNPGYCYLCAGWTRTGEVSSERGRLLLRKPWALAGLAPTRG